MQVCFFNCTSWCYSCINFLCLLASFFTRCLCENCVQLLHFSPHHTHTVWSANLWVALYFLSLKEKQPFAMKNQSFWLLKPLHKFLLAKKRGNKRLNAWQNVLQTAFVASWRPIGWQCWLVRKFILVQRGWRGPQGEGGATPNISLGKLQQHNQRYLPIWLGAHGIIAIPLGRKER